VRCGNGAGDLKEPDEVVDAVSLVVLSPAHIVEGGGGVEVHGGPDAIGKDQVDAGALVCLVEVGQRTAGVEFLARGIEDRRPLHVVQQAFRQVGCGTRSFRPCW